jgi:glycosyltransferase involved in cell wall biosynthesis
MPQVSVIIPNYNHEQYLSQRLDSIFSQTFQDFEVIFLDDCSTDNSLSVFEPYAGDSRVRVHLNNVNSGSPFKQWNKGFDLARGEYIWIAESDDYAAPELLETLVATLDANSRFGVAHCQSWIAKSVETETPEVKVENWYQDFADHKRWREGFQNDGPAELAKYMVIKNTIPNASAVVFRRALLEGGLRAREDMRLAGDWMLWVELLLQNGVAYVPDPLNYWRVAHEGSQRSKTSKHGLLLVEGLQVYSRIVGAVPVAEKTRRAALKYQVRTWGYYACMRRLTLATNRGIYRQLLEVHPEAASHRYRLIILPFIYYFTAVPFRRILVFRATFRGIKWLFLRLAGRPTTERNGP